MKIGILGGMGPFASAEFVKTIYESTVFDKEQQAPDILLHSISSVPDRTESILAEQDRVFIHHLEHNLNILSGLCDRIVIACLTSHFSLPYLKPAIRDKIVSLIDICDRQLPTENQRYLLLATKGAYQKEVFKPLYNRIQLLDSDDLEHIHRFIYEDLKYNRGIEKFTTLYHRLCNKYQSDGVIAGCTEFHLITKRIHQPDIRIIDPLIGVIEELFPQKSQGL